MSIVGLPETEGSLAVAAVLGAGNLATAFGLADSEGLGAIYGVVDSERLAVDYWCRDEYGFVGDIFVCLMGVRSFGLCWSRLGGSRSRV